MTISNRPATANGGRDRPEIASTEHTPLLKKQRSAARKGIVSVKNDEEAGRCVAAERLPGETPRNVTHVISILLLGVFVANVDCSLVLATASTISSDFNDLGNAGWIISSYTLAMCATQSLYGKLSDIYGRKVMIIQSYLFFTVGNALCGLGQSLPQVVLGRLIAGIGGAGISCLVSIVIADLLPIREVASWRSYVNIVAATGRSLGGPIGGYLTDTAGWRWSFLGQCPPTLLAMVLVAWKLEVPTQDVEVKQSHLSKLKRIDFLGTLLLSTSIVCGLLVLDLGGQRMPWSDPRILVLIGASTVTGNCFLMVETFWAKEPIFPLRLLLNRDVVTSYVYLGFQSGAQMAMMMLVPIYFQITAHASITNSGLHLMPSVIGNAIGGLITGVVISRTGRYKLISIIGALSSSTAYSLMMLRWDGHTNFLESLYIAPGGFGNGVALSASFIGLTAGVEPFEFAIASSGLYLSSNIGNVGGLSIAAAILQTTLTKKLRIGLEGLDDRERIIRKSLTDLDFVRSLDGRIGEIVTQAYVQCLGYTHVVSVIGGIVALLAAFCIREHRI